jgi:hypothetical protein
MRMLSNHHVLASLIIFKLSWVSLVVGQQSSVWFALVLLALSLGCQPKPRAAAVRATGIALVGIATDQMLTLAGIFTFHSALIPLWLAVLWLHFGVVLPAGFQFLGRLPLWGQSAVGALAGPLSYWLGATQEGVELATPAVASLLQLALVWALLLPFLLWLSSQPWLVFRRRVTQPFTGNTP